MGDSEEKQTYINVQNGEEKGAYINVEDEEKRTYVNLEETGYQELGPSPPSEQSVYTDLATEL